MGRIKLFRVKVDIGGQRINRERFGRYTPKLGTLFDRELFPEPVGRVIVVSSLPQNKLLQNLTARLNYSTFVLTAFSRGEDFRAVRDDKIQPVWNLFPDKRRHLKGWDSNDELIVITAHDEPAPLCLLRSFRKTTGAHLKQGQGDYKSGTEGFFDEFAISLKDEFRDFAKIIDKSFDSVMDVLGKAGDVK